MTVRQAYTRAMESALDDQELADRLYAGIRQVIDEGTSPETALTILYDLFLTAGDEGRETERDAVAEVMDCLVGWTSERASLRALVLRWGLKRPSAYPSEPAVCIESTVSAAGNEPGLAR